jgi:hypothetical protein
MRILCFFLIPTLLFATHEVQIGDKVNILRETNGANPWAEPAKNPWTVTQVEEDGVHVIADDGTTGFLRYKWRFNEGTGSDFWDTITSGGGGGGGGSTNIIIDTNGTYWTVIVNLDLQQTNNLLDAINQQLQNVDSDDDFLILSALLTEMQGINLEQLESNDLFLIEQKLTDINAQLVLLTEKIKSQEILDKLTDFKQAFDNTGFDSDNDVPELQNIKAELEKLSATVDVAKDVQNIDIKTDGVLGIHLEHYKEQIDEIQNDVNSMRDNIEEIEGDTRHFTDFQFEEKMDELNASIDGIRGEFVDENGTLRQATLADIYLALTESNATLPNEGTEIGAKTAESDALLGAKNQIVTNAIDSSKPNYTRTERPATLGIIDWDMGRGNGQESHDLLNMGQSLGGVSLPSWDEVSLWIKRVIIVAIMFMYYLAVYNLTVGTFQTMIQAQESNVVSNYSAFTFSAGTVAVKAVKIGIWLTFFATVFYTTVMAGYEAQITLWDGTTSSINSGLVNNALNQVSGTSDWSRGAMSFLDDILPIITIFNIVWTFFSQKIAIFLGIFIVNRASRVTS